MVARGGEGRSHLLQDVGKEYSPLVLDFLMLTLMLWRANVSSGRDYLWQITSCSMVSLVRERHIYYTPQPPSTRLRPLCSPGFESAVFFLQPHFLGHLKGAHMNGIRKFPIFTALFFALALVAGSSIVLARAVMQEVASSEDNETIERTQPDSGLIIGDDPDEDGYRGVIPTQDGAAFEPSEVNPDALLVTEPVDWTLYMQGPQPDEEDVTAASESISSVSDWSAFRYIYVAGATLVPRASSTDWTYPGNGCISAAAANDIFNIHLPIPNGSRIDYLRIYYYDTSSSNSQAWVTTYNGAGGFSDLTTVSSAGNTGYGTMLSPFVNHIVDTANNSYVLNWRANQIGSTMRLCGMRVAYRDPA
jgi:hypothetical protein